MLSPASVADFSPADFADSELDLPYYLSHFHRIANAVEMDGPNRGFINISVWRNPKDNKPHNARIMENILALAFFFCTDRPWNVFYAQPDLRQRLEAALDFWCGIQNGDGRFSEYGSGKWNLAATAFATKFMGQTLHLLDSGPAIDSALHQRVIAADRKALYATFTIDELQTHGRNFTNQYANAWGGALAYLDLFPDSELERLLDQRLEESLTEFQSPVGYFYERSGPDWGYFLGTHHSDIHVAYHYARGTDRASFFIEKERRWYDWFSYNAVREPDGTGYALNRAIETRQQRAFLTEYRANLGGAERSNSGDIDTTALGEELELPRAYGRTAEAHARDIADARARLEANWPTVAPLQVGEFWAFTPYAFLHRDHITWYPTLKEKKAATATLPYIARDHFTHQRVDSRHPVVFTFVRRPTYYAAFNTGPVLSAQQRYGLGLLWHPRAGAVLQSQTDTDHAAWGTVVNHTLCEKTDIAAAFRINGNPIIPRPGIRDLPDGDLEITYPLGEAGSKTILFASDAITVSVNYPGAFTEVLPLLKGEMDIIENGAVLTRGDVSFYIETENALTLSDTDLKSGDRQVVTAHINAEETLTYRIALR